MIGRLRGWRIGAALALTLWLAGWVPSIIWSWRVGGGPQFYAVWIILGPVFLANLGIAAVGLWYFYRWAFQPAARPSKDDLARRIAELERELDIR